MSSRMDIVKAIFNPDHTTIFSVGSRNTMTGANADSTTRMRTEYLDKGITVIAPCSGYKFMLFAYMDNGGYVGVWNGSTFVIPDGSWLTTPLNIAALNKYYKYKIIAAITGNPESASISFPTISQVFSLRIVTPRILSIIRRNTTVKAKL